MIFTVFSIKNQPLFEKTVMCQPYILDKILQFSRISKISQTAKCQKLLDVLEKIFMKSNVIHFTKKKIKIFKNYPIAVFHSHLKFC